VRCTAGACTGLALLTQCWIERNKPFAWRHVVSNTVVRKGLVRVRREVPHLRLCAKWYNVNQSVQIINVSIRNWDTNLNDELWVLIFALNSFAIASFWISKSLVFAAASLSKKKAWLDYLHNTSSEIEAMSNSIQAFCVSVLSAQCTVLLDDKLKQTMKLNVNKHNNVQWAAIKCIYYCKIKGLNRLYLANEARYWPQNKCNRVLRLDIRLWITFQHFFGDRVDDRFLANFALY